MRFRLVEKPLNSRHSGAALVGVSSLRGQALRPHRPAAARRSPAGGQTLIDGGPRSDRPKWSAAGWKDGQPLATCFRKRTAWFDDIIKPAGPRRLIAA